MDQRHTPLYDALKQHSRRPPISFHVPGHKYGAVFPAFARDDFQSILRIDVTELSGLDDLHDPQDAILDAERLTAALYGVERSRFLVNGTSVGNLAMILGVCSEGDIVLVQRNCHKSVLNGLQLAGARPVFLKPEVDPSSQVPIGVTLDVLQDAIRKFPEARAVILTHPSYYGTGFELGEMVAFIHRMKIPVLVDEAHGAHFGIGSPFPESAIHSGADVVVQSAHKTLPAMTMGSYIHFNSDLVDQEKIIHYLGVLQSSSPSYPLMASLDIARWYRANMQGEELTRVVSEMALFRNALEAIPQVNLLGKGKADFQDPLKVTLQTNTGLTGYELQSLLEESHVFSELADPLNVLFVLPLGYMKDWERVVTIMKDLLEQYPAVEVKRQSFSNLDAREGVTALPFSYSEMSRFRTKTVPLVESVGSLAADSIVPYPPGVPLLARGETITDRKLEQLSDLYRQGAKFQGANPFQMKGIRVYITS